MFEHHVCHVPTAINLIGWNPENSVAKYMDLHDQAIYQNTDV
jgi:hypothetical protein